MTSVLTLSNLLSLSRAFFALAFLQENTLIRLIALACAMLSDFLDGFLARRSGTTSRVGALLDPIMDKFFVLFVGTIFLLEERILVWQLIALMSRDISLCCFGLYLSLVRGWKGYEVRAIWWGKATTAAQFLLLLTLTLNFRFPAYVYYTFIIMAAGAFFELFSGFRKKNTEK